MSRSYFVAAQVVFAACSAGSEAALAGPCTDQIAAVERQIQAAPAGPQSGPSAAQSVGAQLHHQPTPGSVQSAEGEARSAAAAALLRARAADAAGDAAACKKALEDVRELYGLQ